MVDLTIKRKTLQTGLLDYYNLRFGALMAAIVIYALKGSPTPDDPGYIEALIGVLLVAAVGIGPLYYLARYRWDAPLWHKSGQLLLYYGISIPVVIGITSGHSTTLIIRDLLPFLFLVLPVFLHSLLDRKYIYARLTTVAVCFVGLSFSARVLWPPDIKNLFQTVPDDALYLSIAPTVLFTAILLAGSGGKQLYQSLKAVSVAKGGGMLLLAAIPLLAIVLVVQRASAGLFVLSMLALLTVAFFRKPYRAIPLILIAAVIVMAGWPYLTTLFSSFSEKTALVGLNMRIQEALAVIKMVSGSFWEVLFGKGWGATLSSPAVGGLSVNFTHSLLTTYWLKTGLVGLACALVYLCVLGFRLVMMVNRYPVLVLAIAMPVVIDVFLYASFKSFDFGLLLLLIPMWANTTRRLKP